MAGKTYKIERGIRKKLNKTRHHQRFLCNAPFVSVSIGVTGFASPCCYMNNQTEYFIHNSDCFPEKKLFDIWNSENFQFYRECFKKKAYPKECVICKNAVEAGNFESVKSKMYDRYTPHPVYPRIIELTLDNTCNLQCVMCSSLHSSQIARKNGMVIEKKNDIDASLSEIRKFIPYLEEMIISGGEPFLSLPSKKLMQEIVTNNPACLISVNTNGTILTDEIKLMMEMGNFNFNLSLDSINKSIYEKIRVGANFETVITNLTYFADYAKRKNRGITIPICPLKLNYSELPDIVSFCNVNAYYIVFVHVFKAHDFALSSADPELLKEALQMYESFSFPENDPIQRHNAEQFHSLIRDVRSWLIFAGKKSDFIGKLEINEEDFNQANYRIEKRIEKYILLKSNDNAASERLAKWVTKKNKLFEIVPWFFRHELFYSRLFSFPDEILLHYIEDLSLKDLKEFFLTFGDEIIEDNS